MLLFHFIEEEYLDDVLFICDVITHDDYYVKMAVAWCLQVCFVHYPQETMRYLKENNLDNETYNMALKKITESLKVDSETKEIIKSMKRK